MKTISITQPPIFLATFKALAATLAADKEQFARLPVPIRYRACGAIHAWEDARRTADKAGAAFSAWLADPNVSPQELLSIAASFVDRSGVAGSSGVDDRHALGRCANSAYWQAFWARNGALYEPTQAMQSLFNATDLAQDIPLRMLRPPLATMCIVPPVSVWAEPDGFEAILLFSHAAQEIPGQGVRRRLSLVAQKKTWTAGLGFEIDDAGEQTIAQALNKLLEEPEQVGPADVVSGTLRRRLERVLDYTVKVLLYLSLENAHCVPERLYSNAPKTFPGLGRRKRELRLAEVEQLYDRYIVGPQALSDELSSHTDGTSGHSVSAHWRRGHFRLQPHGPQASLRKVMFIMPTLVRADRLA